MFRYEARYDGMTTWQPISESTLRHHLSREVPDPAMLDTILDGSEADAEVPTGVGVVHLVYRAVRTEPEPGAIVALTTAPAVYDSMGTTELAASAGTDHRGYTLRRIAIRPEHYDWQAGRYQSGLHAVATEAEAARFPSIYRLA